MHLSEPQKPWAFCSAPRELTDSVDIWERNELVCPKTGNQVFIQHIWWRFETHEIKGKEVSDYFIGAWRLDKDVKVRPVKVGEVFVGRFFDSKEKVFREIRAVQYMETITQVDYEVHDKGRLPEDKRSGLRQK